MHVHKIWNGQLQQSNMHIWNLKSKSEKYKRFSISGNWQIRDENLTVCWRRSAMWNRNLKETKQEIT